MHRLRRVLGVAVLSVLVGGVPAAAQEVPPPTPATPDPVAQVGSVAISGAEFDRWFAQVTHGEPVGKHRSLRRVTMQFLVQAQWIEQEAALRGVAVSEQRVDRLFKSQRRQAFPKKGGYERFLRESGTDEASIKYRIRVDLLQDGVTRDVTSAVRRVTKRDVARYRARHPRRFDGMPSAKAKRKARRVLTVKREIRALARFVVNFHERYRAKTWCADGYRISECGAIAPS